jgi:CheY-like chemotaxis protein
MKPHTVKGEYSAPRTKKGEPPRPDVIVIEDANQSHPHGVLIVDDCELMRLMLRLALEQTGFRVWVANTGAEAINLYREHRAAIAAVLLDVQMPGLDGPRTLDALRDLGPDIQVCFVSGDTGQYTPEELIRRGARAVFSKPFRITDLADAVLWMLSGEPPPGFDARQPELRAAAIFAEDFDCVVAETKDHSIRY